MFDTTKFGALVATLRKGADMTQSELADRLGLTRQAISRYECGDSFPDISVLREMAAIFGISVELLISSGNPTEGEAEILRAIASGKEIKQANAVDVANLAPWLRPSILTKLSESMSKTGIDISHVIALAEYMNETDTDKLMKSVSFDNLADMDPGLLGKLLPLLGPYATDTVLQKIIDGELDYHYLEMFGGGYQYVSLIEAACIYGALDMDALHIMRRHNYNRFRTEKRGSVIHLFTCPKCGAPLPHFYPRRCKCGHQVHGDGNILRFSAEDGQTALCDSLDFAPEILQKYGSKLLILMLGAEIDVAALSDYYDSGHETCEFVVVDDNLSRLQTLEKKLHNEGFITIARVYDNPADPHVMNGMFDIIIDNTAGKLADLSILRGKLNETGIILRGGEMVFAK